MKFIFFLTLVLLCCGFSVLKAGFKLDSNSSFWKYVDLGFQSGVLYSAGGYDIETEMPEYLRPPEEKGFLAGFNTQVGDSPLFHGCAYFKLKTNIKRYGFNIYTEIIAEHRGISYGVTNSKAMIVFPKYKFAYDSSFSLFGQKFYTGISTGNYFYEKKFEGLNIFNMEYQGTIIYLKAGVFKLAYHKIGDMTYGTGLNIDDGNFLVLSAEEINLPEGFKCDLRVGQFSHPLGTEPNSTTFQKSGNMFSIGVYKDNFRIYSEFSLLVNSTDINYDSGFLAGATYIKKTDDYSYDISCEYRRFGYAYNKYLINKNSSYGTGDWGESIGPNLYPLERFDRQFAQWAVFTEYQNKNVYGLTLLLNAQYRLIDKIYFHANFDFNYIRASGLDGFLYPFYKLGFIYEPADFCTLGIHMTNRGMNLTKHYPTLHLYSEPVTQLSMYFKI